MRTFTDIDADGVCKSSLCLPSLLDTLLEILDPSLLVCFEGLLVSLDSMGSVILDSPAVTSINSSGEGLAADFNAEAFDCF